MGWISFCLFALLVSSCHSKPVEDEVEADAKIALLEARETPDEEQAVTADVDENEIKRYNDYMDAVYRRMNAALRAKLMDPMELNLDARDERKGKKKNKKDSAKRVTREAGEEIVDAEEVDDEDEVDRMGELDDEEAQDAEVDRMGEVEKEKKKNKRKNGKNKKKERKDDDDGEMEETKKKKKANKNKKSNKSKDRKDKKSTKKEKKEKRAEKRAKKAAKKQEREANRKNQEGDERSSLSRERRNKQSKERASRKQKRKDSDEGKAKGSLSGIATLRRSGPVEITEEEDHKIISSEFTVGPLQLEVSKSFGEAKERRVKTAKASTDVMKGVMVLKVKADGSAHVKKVVFKKPDHVDVSGSLSAKERKSETQLRNSFNRSRGLAAQKILKTARYVLKNTE